MKFQETIFFSLVCQWRRQDPMLGDGTHISALKNNLIYSLLPFLFYLFLPTRTLTLTLTWTLTLTSSPFLLSISSRKATASRAPGTVILPCMDTRAAEGVHSSYSAFVSKRASRWGAWLLPILLITTWMTDEQQMALERPPWIEVNWAKQKKKVYFTQYLFSFGKYKNICKNNPKTNGSFQKRFIFYSKVLGLLKHYQPLARFASVPTQI